MRYIMVICYILGNVFVGKAQYNNPIWNDSITGRPEIQINGGISIQSTSIQKGFFNSFLYGGMIDQKTKDRSMNHHFDKNRMGIASINEIVWIAGNAKIGKKDSICWLVKAGENAIGSANYSDDFFRLAFYGNSSFANDSILFSGSSLNFMLFQKIGFGLLSKKNKSGIVLNLINVQQAYNSYVTNGVIYQNADVSDINMRLRGDFAGTNNKSFSNGLGIGIDANYKFETPWFKEATTFFEISAQNLGFAYMYNGMNTYHVDSTFNYSGFDFSQLVNGTTSLGSDFSILDSLGIQQKTEKKVLALPGFIQVAKLVDPNSLLKFQSYFGVRLFPTLRTIPSIFAGVYYRVSTPLSLAASVAYGGFGNFRTGIYATYSCKFAHISLGTDDVIGMVSKSGYGQSVVLKSTWKL